MVVTQADSSRALTAAAQMHAAQVRKATTVPYVGHLLGTCAIALEYGANEDEAMERSSMMRSRTSSRSMTPVRPWPASGTTF